MDINTKNTSVAVNNIIYDKNLELPIDVDFSMPDYCPEINKVLKCKATTRVFNKSLNGQIVTIDGNTCINVLYSDENCNVFNYEYNIPFSKSVDTGFDLTDGNVFCKSNTEYLNCRVVTKRKIEIHGASCLSIKVNSKRTSNIICEAQGAQIKTNCNTACVTVDIGSIEKNLIIEEELNISNQPAVRNIIRYDANTVIKDSKIIGKKAVIKGEFTLFMLYSHDNESVPQSFEQVLPFSQIIDIDTLTEECMLDVKCDIINLEIKPRTQPDGYFTEFILCSKLCISVNAFCNSEFNVVFDAYSTRYDTQLKFENVCLEKMVKEVNDNFICTKKIEFSDGDIENIIDIWSENSRFSSAYDGKNIIINGTAIICILARDNSNNCVYHERPVDYEYKLEIDDAFDDIKCEPNIVSNVVGYSLNELNCLDVKVQINISAIVFNCKKINVVTKITVNECEKTNTAKDISLYIYYAEKGEHLWDIARKYNSCKDDIIKINDLNSDELPCDKALVIPVC